MFLIQNTFSRSFKLSQTLQRNKQVLCILLQSLFYLGIKPFIDAIIPLKAHAINP